MSKPIQFMAPLELSAEDGDSLPKKFNGVAYSGGKVSHYRNLVIDLGSTETAPDMPLLFQHRHDETIGVGNASNSGQQITIDGELFSDIDDTAKSIAQKSKRGLKYQMSIGLFDYSVENVPEGKGITVNGRNFQGPITVLRNGTVRETSVVALGADSNTNSKFFQADPSQPQPKEGDMPDELQARLTALQADKDRLTTELATASTALTAANDKVTALQATIDAGNKEARLASVKALFKATGREFAEDAAKPYMDMDSVLFDSMSADQLALAKSNTTIPSALFEDTATGDPTSGDAVTLTSIAKKRYS